jgi:hypothetical protein
MKSKVINLFNKQQMVAPNQGEKYSKLLEKFIEPFVEHFDNVEFYEELIEFAIHAWNTANLRLLLPKDDDTDAEFESTDNGAIDLDLLKKMIDYKIIHFKNYTNFIVDYNLIETIEEPILEVTSQDQESYLKSMFEQFEQDVALDNFDESFINRSAIIIKPLQPFIDWLSNLYPEDLNEFKESNTYLISEDNENIESWLEMKFDKIFAFELESWHTNQKKWPKKRNYKMFKEWFQVDFSTMIYDFERAPILKI